MLVIETICSNVSLPCIFFCTSPQILQIGKGKYGSCRIGNVDACLSPHLIRLLLGPERTRSNSGSEWVVRTRTSLVLEATATGPNLIHLSILCIDTDVPVRHPTVEEQQLKSPQIMRTFVPLIQNSTVTALVLKSWIGLGPKSVLMNRLAPCLCVKSVCVTICILQCIGFLTQNLAFLKQLSAFCRKQHVQTCFCHVQQNVCPILETSLLKLLHILRFRGLGQKKCPLIHHQHLVKKTFSVDHLRIQKAYVGTYIDTHQ